MIIKSVAFLYAYKKGNLFPGGYEVQSKYYSVLRLLFLFVLCFQCLFKVKICLENFRKVSRGYSISSLL